MNEIMAKIYWRSIQRGTRTIEDVPEELRDAVIELSGRRDKDGLN